jgi:5-carboxymethyl-2-hydroxymuconate isomerase
MSLKDRFQSLAVLMINTQSAFLSVSQPVILSQPILEQYDVESGMVFRSMREITVNGIVGPWEDSRLQALNSYSVQTEDLKCLLAFLDVSLDLNIGHDTVTLQDGTVYSIVSKKVDPAEASIILRLSKIVEELDE